MVAIMIISVSSNFSLLIIIMISKMFHFGRNPSKGGTPPRLRRRVERIRVFDLFIFILSELRFLKNNIIEIKMVQ